MFLFQESGDGLYVIFCIQATHIRYMHDVQHWNSSFWVSLHNYSCLGFKINKIKFLTILRGHWRRQKKKMEVIFSENTEPNWLQVNAFQQPNSSQLQCAHHLCKPVLLILAERDKTSILWTHPLQISLSCALETS